ncbi:MAG: hypothetical protein WBM50_14875 [Acidimicrobiales bacterium]
MKAAELASIDGLAGISLSQIADALEMPKSSVQVAYSTKQELQLAAIAAANEIFVDAVVKPASTQAKGLPRLTAIVDAWLTYVTDRVLPGGCFMSATFAEFDSRPGPVRDALADMRRQWLGLLEHHCAIAQADAAIPPHPTPELLAFEIDALLAAANIARNIHDDRTALTKARRVISHRLETATHLTDPEDA